MVDVEAVTLGVHVLAGFVALFAGAGALVTKKGGQRHRRFGRFFVRGMAIVAATAFVLLLLDPTRTRQFLALIAVFSYYFVFSGYRVLSRKRPADDPEPVDWAATGALAVSGVLLLAFGATRLLAGTQFGVVLAVFGGIGVVFGATDARSFRAGESEPRAWFFEHLTRMGAAYIATVTAFSAVNATFVPTAVAWLWPTAVGSPAIYLLARRYRARFAPAAA